MRPALMELHCPDSAARLRPEAKHVQPDAWLDKLLQESTPGDLVAAAWDVPALDDLLQEAGGHAALPVRAGQVVRADCNRAAGSLGFLWRRGDRLRPPLRLLRYTAISFFSCTAIGKYNCSRASENVFSMNKRDSK
jgi:hypothetical protein